jgi:lipoprotein-anchoring transpeptidase ErfK/SrfK
MLASTALLAFATPAQAVPFNLQPAAAPLPYYVRPAMARPAKPSGITTASREKAATAAKNKDGTEDLAAKARGILSVVISIDKQQLTLYSDGQPVAHSRVSTGQPGHATPTGVFSIIQRDRWHRSNLYGNAPMWFMQRITWSGVAMHQGIVPNYPASHGCIRLPEAFARQMWGTTKMGARVIVTYGDVTPVAISHARLFKLKTPEPAEPKIEAKLEARQEPAQSSTAVVKSAYNALEVAQFAATTQGKTATDAPKVGGSALDAITYALGTSRETPATFEPAKPRAKSVVSLGEDRPLKPGPVSVFISRKEGKLFVRKGFDPVFDVPVTFEGAQLLGTHVYTAVALNDDNTFRWHVMSMPGGATPVKKVEKGKEKGKKVEVVTGPAATATQALDRVNVPPEAIERISELMSAGASLIISDKGISGETGKGTDFIVLTR